MARAATTIRRARKTGTSRHRGHYTWNGLRYVSVTTVLDIIGKPAIPRWAAIEVAKFVGEQLKLRELHVETKGAAGIDGTRLAAILADQQLLAGIPWEKRDVKADLGTIIHDIAERWALTGVEPSSMHRAVKPYGDALLEWLRANNPTFIATEATIINKTFGYAGTTDGLIMFPKGTTINLDGFTVLTDPIIMLDFKTSRETWKEHALQLSAYRRGEFIIIERTNIPDGFEYPGMVQTPEGIEIPMPQCEEAAILLVNPRGCQLMHWPTEQREFDAFLAAKTLWEWFDLNLKPREISPVATVDVIAGALGGQ